jgi:hypothetical protein
MPFIAGGLGLIFHVDTLPSRPTERERTYPSFFFNIRIQAWKAFRHITSRSDVERFSGFIFLFQDNGQSRLR